MAETADDFLDRVFAHVGELSDDKFNYTSWKFEKRPTSEAVGVIPGQAIDVENAVKCILNVEAYPENVKFVENCTILEKRSDTDFTYIQQMSLPIIGKVQCALNLADYGEREGFRVVAWRQNDEETDKLNKKQGFRTDYNLGAWLLKDDSVAYSLSSCPRKKDVGSIKFAIMTKGADSTASTVLQQNIQAMSEWANRS